MDSKSIKRRSAKKESRKRSVRIKEPVSPLRRFMAAGMIIFLVSLAFLSSQKGKLSLLDNDSSEPQEAKSEDSHIISFEEEKQPPITITGVDIDEGVADEFRIEVLNPKTPQATALSGSEPKVLIYHTHTTEAYRQTDTYKYEENGEWRTKDQDKSIVAVGKELARILSEEYGCNVLHDTTDHEPPKLSSSYNRSLETMLAYKEKYPSLELYIDVHRDAGKDPTFTVVDGKKVAHMMFVVGSGKGATGTGYKEMPNFESNFALANAITESIRATTPEIMRNIRVKTSRYNQHVSDMCLLAEIGDNMSTLEEALNAVPYLAKAIVEVLGNDLVENEKTQTVWAPH